MKIPKLQNLLALKLRKKLHASTAARRSPAIPDNYEEQEPQTRLSSAFIVVLVLHVVAVGGIYAFNSIKAHRKTETPLSASTVAVKPAAHSPSTSSLRPSTDGAVPSKALIGQERVTPTRAAGLASSASPAPAPAALTRAHRVVAGDNLTKIAAQYGVTVAELEEANGAKNVATLRIGQLVTIPKPAATAKTTPATFYVVKKDDNPMTIARKLHVNQADLLKLNNIEDPKKLQPGQKLKVPPPKKIK